MSSSFMPADMASLLGVSNTTTASNSTSRKGNTELNMEDFLTLMVVQLQNQTIDDTMDTSEMMNQMIQMQMVTAISNMTDASVMSYASSLVGHKVTIGILNGDVLEERVIDVVATGTYNGQQVIFDAEGNYYALSQIMAVGELPEIKPELPDEGDGDDAGTEDVEGSGSGNDNNTDTDNSTNTDNTTGDVTGGEDVSKLPDDRPVNGADEIQDTQETNEYGKVEAAEGVN